MKLDLNRNGFKNIGVRLLCKIGFKKLKDLNL